jgi:enoyl-CoA hydratase/carnithine racemase
MIEKDDTEGVRILRLNRPPANTLTPDMLRQIRENVDSARTDPHVRCILLTSALPKYFSAGLDIEAIFAASEESRIDFFIGLLETHRVLAAYPGPTIASIGGYAMLGGWILAMACDFRWMAEESGRFALSEIRYGLTPTEFLIRRLRVMGADQVLTRQLVLKGKTLKADEAFSGRFVDRLVATADLDAQVLQEAKKLAKLPPRAYASIKASFAKSVAHDDGLWERSMKDFREIFEGPEARIGLAAMREKKTPRWE